jgi:hypothetical protein
MRKIIAIVPGLLKVGSDVVALGLNKEDLGSYSR